MRVDLVALTLLLAASCDNGRSEGPAVLVGSIVEQRDRDLWGGFSGIEVSPDGNGITLLSDAGFMVGGRLERDGEGRPRRLEETWTHTLAPPSDVDPGRRGLDTEGLAVSPDGIFVSLERIHEVWRLDRDGTTAERLPQHPAFAGLQTNSSLEALAADADGALYTLPERSGERTRPFPVWRYADGTWTHVFDLPRRGRFLAVGADFGPDGRLYLLERGLRLPLAFATRVRRFDVTGSAVANEETLLETPPGLHDNLEGIAVWQDAEGATRLTMVSDDNRLRWLQETQIVEYRLPSPLDARTRER